MQTISVAYQTISSDFTQWDKCKRFGRSLLQTGKNFFTSVREKIAEAKDAIAQFFHSSYKTSTRCYSEVVAIFKQIKQDFGGDKDMGFWTNLSNAILGPSSVSSSTFSQGANFEDFSTGDIANNLAGVIRQQNGYVSEEQADQINNITNNYLENLKRLKPALANLKKLSGAENETAKEVFGALRALQSDTFKRSELQSKRRQESQALQQKYNNLRKGL